MRNVMACTLVVASAFISSSPFAKTSSASGAGAEVSHTVLAASGVEAPGGGIYSGFSSVKLNTRGEAAFRATLRGPSTTGVFLRDRTGTAPIALGGDPDPSSANFGFVGDPSITRRGDVLFDADGSSTFVSNRGSLAPL